MYKAWQGKEEEEGRRHHRVGNKTSIWNVGHWEWENSFLAIRWCFDVRDILKTTIFAVCRYTMLRVQRQLCPCLLLPQNLIIVTTNPESVRLQTVTLRRGKCHSRAISALSFHTWWSRHTWFSHSINPWMAGDRSNYSNFRQLPSPSLLEAGSHRNFTV